MSGTFPPYAVVAGGRRLRGAWSPRA